MRERPLLTILLGVVILALLAFGVRACVQIKNDKPSDNTPNTIFVTTPQGNPTEAATSPYDLPAVTDPSTTTIVAPNTGIALSTYTYPNDPIGHLNFDNGTNMTVYEAYRNEYNEIKIPSSGVAYWGGYFFGHLIQKNNGLDLMNVRQVTWISLNGSQIMFDIGSSADYNGFNSFTALPYGNYSIVTCWIDTVNSTTDNLIFGGNKIYSLSIR